MSYEKMTLVWVQGEYNYDVDVEATADGIEIALEADEITGKQAAKELRDRIESSERHAKYKTRLGRRYSCENESAT